MDNMRQWDPPTAAEIQQAFNHWDDIELKFKGRSVRSGGHGFVGIGRKKLLNILQARCEQLGVKLLFETDVDSDADYPDADTFVYILHSAGGFLGRMCGSPEIDRLAERGRAETTPVQRHALYRQVEETMAREALLLPLFHEQAYRFAQPDVGGLSVSFGIPLVAYEELHLRG